MSDEDLRASFEALKARDRKIAPPFARMKSEAERRARARKMRMGAVWSASVAIAAMVLLAIWVGRPTEDRMADPSVALASEEPLGFLLEPPAATVLGEQAPIDQIGEAW